MTSLSQIYVERITVAMDYVPLPMEEATRGPPAVVDLCHDERSYRSSTTTMSWPPWNKLLVQLSATFPTLTSHSLRESQQKNVSAFPPPPYVNGTTVPLGP